MKRPLIFFALVTIATFALASAAQAKPVGLVDVDRYIENNSCNGRKKSQCLIAERFKRNGVKRTAYRYAMASQGDSLGLHFMLKPNNFMLVLAAAAEGSSKDLGPVLERIYDQVAFALDGRFIVKQKSGSVTARTIIEPGNSKPNARAFGEARINSMAISFLMRVSAAVLKSRLSDEKKRVAITYFTALSSELLASLTFEIRAYGAGTRSKTFKCGPAGLSGSCYFFFSRGGVKEKGKLFPHAPLNYMVSTLGDLYRIESAYRSLASKSASLLSGQPRVRSALKQGSRVATDLLAGGTAYLAWAEPSMEWGPGSLAHHLTKFSTAQGPRYWLEYERNLGTGELDLKEGDEWIRCHYHYETLNILRTMRLSRTQSGLNQRLDRAFDALFAKKGPIRIAYEAATDPYVGNWAPCPAPGPSTNSFNANRDYTMYGDTVNDFNRWFSIARANPVW